MNWPSRQHTISELIAATEGPSVVYFDQRMGAPHTNRW